MVKYLIKKKMKKEAEEKGKKALIYTGAVLTGVGAYFSYRAIKNRRINQELEEERFLEDSEYEIYNYENEDDQLEEKVKEFNARRINFDDSNHSSKEELESYVKESEEIKENEKDEVALDEDVYKESEYDKYDYYEEDLSKEE
ncbi:hypothetical protein [Romboutsia lituseburensis]|uniref:hypothetical protein n=1 Tax=Romboutsia lituseburensis TaxID=1537 RepID=UPI00215B2889|nr:hypothetical protein [Romboutsia lituseburensis]MCR8744983.1 hypothetical protein [Romboutsia lituseburensis]